LLILPVNHLYTQSKKTEKSLFPDINTTNMKMPAWEKCSINFIFL